MGSMRGILFAVVGFEDEGRFVLGSEVVFSNWGWFLGLELVSE